MINKHVVLLAMLIPGLAVLAGCNGRDADGTVAPVATTMPAPADSMPAEPMPADPMPADNMAGQDMAGMAGHDMAAMGNDRSFADMDKNHDGGVTHDEMMDTEMLHQHFAVADTNADGTLSEAEIMKHRADMAAAPAK